MKQKIEINGRFTLLFNVESIWFGDPGKQYGVRYFYNGKADTVHFYESELELDDSSNSKKDD